MHKLVQRQLERARTADGSVDLEQLAELVSAAYEDADHDRRRTDRSIGLMVEELDELNRDLERLVAERTATLKTREAELEEQNRRFDAAINNISQGLVLYDETARLVICNRRYLEMYGLTEAEARPGTSLLELLQLRQSRGMFTGVPEDVVAEILGTVARGQNHTWIGDLEDGRTISVLIRPIATGGWIATHEDVSDRRHAEKRIAHMARHDTLTDLPNRVMLVEQLEEVAARQSGNQRIAVLHIDIDRFKAVNDGFGHLVGDELLIGVAARVRSCLGSHDLVARVGGDEFAVVQTEVGGGGTETAALATRICEAFRTPVSARDQSIPVEVSVGIAIGPGASTDASELLKNADIALRRAKAESRGSFRFFEPEMDARMRARRELETALRAALAAGGFDMRYQPIVDLRSGEIVGCEALLRWTDADLGSIPPDVFVPLAEEIGLIVPIGEWALRRACGDAAAWDSHVRVAVNLSPLQLLSPGLVPMVVNALAGSGLSPERLELEITESVLMQNTTTTLATLHQLRGLGIRISMDDFGTGYSSLSNLRSFPFDRIKIDRSFVTDLPDGRDAVAIVGAVASLAHSLGIATTAEGVETATQMELVHRLGCTEMQGFLFSRPLTAPDVGRLFAAQAPRRAMAG